MTLYMYDKSIRAVCTLYKNGEITLATRNAFLDVLAEERTAWLDAQFARAAKA